MYLSVLKSIVALISLLNSAISLSVKVDESQGDRYNASFGENRLAAQLLALLDHYKQDDPAGIPGNVVPDPMSVPDITKSLGLATLKMKNISAYGLSNFHTKTLDVDLQMLKAHVVIQLDNMNMIGDYTLGYSAGQFNVTLKNVLVSGNASLIVDFKGSLKTQDIQIDIVFSDMSMDFQNLGFFASFFQGAINSAPDFFFETIKPFMLVEIYMQIRTEVDANIAKASGDFRFPTSISPLDMAMAECRRYVRNMGWDPFLISDYSHKMEVFAIEMTNTWLRGISSFYRFGKMAVSVENNTVSIHFQLATQKITGSTHWTLSIANGMMTEIGRSEFTVQHIQASIDLHQPLDMRKKAKIGRVKIDLGNIQLRHEGTGTLDYLLEFGGNVLPNVLRNQIMDVLKNPIRKRIQEKLDQVDMEKVIREYLSYFQKNNN